MMRISSITILLFVLMFLDANASSIAAPVTQQETQSSLSFQPADKPAQMNGITQTASVAGVSTCLQSIERLSNFIVSNTQSKALLFFPPKDINRQIVSVSFEVELPNKSTAYATMSAAPTAEGGCDALYETVSYWSENCAVVAVKGFAGTRPAGVVQKHIRVLEGSQHLKIFLMPVGEQGCVAIKKEVIY